MPMNGKEYCIMHQPYSMNSAWQAPTPMIEC